MSQGHEEQRYQAVLEFASNRPLAHAVLFAHRHPDATPAFHHEIVELISSASPRALIMAFRGGAKSTLMEEDTVLSACFQEFKNKVILGASFARARDRLQSIKYEFEHNEVLEQLFGNLVGGTWNEDKIVLSNGVCIQAFGREQSFRGVKHLDFRPDRLDLDDYEDEDAVRTPEAREFWLKKFLTVLMPACTPDVKVRVYATPLDPESLPMKLRKLPEWVTRVYPVRYQGANGWEPSWPERFSLAWIDKTERETRALGKATYFAQEYMCLPEDEASKLFTDSMIRVVPKTHVWQPTYAVYDPARTTNATSASYGKVVFSWIANRLIVWDGGGYTWKPDEMIADMFAVEDAYHPIEIGVEQTGLNDWVLQPMRQAQVARAQYLPVRPLNAPRDKLGFIKSIQPFFKAGEVEFAKDLPSAKEQLLSFPTGQIDFPNALAYALVMRPGQPIYDGFSQGHVSEELGVARAYPVFLAVNASGAYTVAVLVQVVDGALHVLVDWVREGDPGSVLGDIVAAAGLEVGRHFRAFAPLRLFDGYESIGLVPAARKVPLNLRPGGEEASGREELRRLLSMSRRGLPHLRVSVSAKWTLNAFAGGYAKKVLKGGMLADEAVEGPYRILMEGLESFAALLRTGTVSEDKQVKMAIAPDGRRYATAMATGEGPREMKG